MISLTWGRNLRILPLPFDSLHGTRRSSAALCCLLDGGVSCPFPCALCRKNCFAWHISAPPQGVIFFHQKPGVHQSWPLFKSVSRITSPGENLGDLQFLFCQPPSLTPFPTPLKFYKLMTVCMCSADGQKTWKDFLDFSPPVCLIWITCWKLKLAPIALCLQGGPVGQSVVPSEYRAPSGMWVMLMWLARALGVGWGANYYFFGHDLFPLPFFFLIK